MYGVSTPALYSKQLYQSENISLPASGTTNINRKALPVFGQIASFIAEINVTITKGTGTIDTTKFPYSVVNSLVLVDKNGKTIVSLAGDEIPKARKVLTLVDTRDYRILNKGDYNAGTALADSASEQTFRVEVPLNVALKDQPISIEAVISNLSSVLSVVGTGTAICDIRLFAIMYKQPTGQETDRIYTRSLGTIAAEKDVSDQLPTGVRIEAIAIDTTADTNFDHLTLKPVVDEGIDKAEDVDLKEYEDLAYRDGHLTGFYILPVSPFNVTKSTSFIYGANTSHTPKLYILHHGARL